MSRVIFWILVAVNAALFAFHQDFFGAPSQTRREPERMQRQLNPKQIKLQAADPKAVSAHPELAKAEAAPSGCIEIGNFSADQAKVLEHRLSPLKLGERLTRTDVEEVSSHMVYIPSLGSREAADRKVAELRKLGITTYFVMSDSATQRWAISLGVFKSEQAARKQMAELMRRGVRGVHLAPRGVASGSASYRLRNLDASSMEALDRIMGDFPDQQKRLCER